MAWFMFFKKTKLINNVGIDNQGNYIIVLREIMDYKFKKRKLR